MSKTTPIHEALTAIMADCGAIAKGRKNQQQGYSFRGIDDLYNAIHPLFAKHGVFVTSEVIERHREERQTQRGGLLLYTTLRVKFTFYASDGSSVSSITEGEAMDSADKSTNKAMSAALKYCLMQMLLIPTEELKDADAVTPEPAPKPKQKPVLSPESPTWEQVVAAIASGQRTIEQAKQKFVISAKDLELLQRAADHLKAEIENQQEQKR
jgi:hypothetical protein